MARPRKSIPIGCGAAVAVLGMIVGCSTAPPAPTVRTDLDDLMAATLHRVQIDGTARVGESFTITSRGRQILDGRGQSSLRIAPEGPSVDASTVITEAPGAAPTTTRLIVRPDGVYVDAAQPGGPPPARPWTRLDPALRDPLTGADYSGTVALQRQTGTRIFCFTEVGPASLSGATRTVLDGVTVIRYALRIDLTRPGVDRGTGDRLRSLGLASVTAFMDVDEQDRVLRCAVDETVPGGTGRVVDEQRFGDFGAPINIAPPPPELIAD